MKILIADDDKDIQEIITYNLNKENYNVVSADNGLEAIEIVKKNKLDLILLDVMMPQLDGIEACQEIRELGKDDTIIVMLSARDEN
ncbi:MAG: response regulator, partial [Bacteroidota bacterium]|nr:response regulator [Bacteroidota bacterium]